MDVSKLVAEFKSLHEMAKAGQLSPEQVQRWEELRRRLSGAQEPSTPRDSQEFEQGGEAKRSRSTWIPICS